jgi:1,4-alpha-glucan branching enzyme
MPGSDGADGSGPANASVNPTESVVYVQFMLDAPGASSVSVAGDFSEWEPSFTLEDVDGDGVWTGRVPVQPGVHTYMFLIDGTEWRTDPRADRYRDDGFGNRNAVLAVASGA